MVDEVKNKLPESLRLFIKNLPTTTSSFNPIELGIAPLQFGG